MNHKAFSPPCLCDCLDLSCPLSWWAWFLVTLWFPLLPVHFRFISCGPISNECPPSQYFGSLLMPWIPTLALFRLADLFCPFPLDFSNPCKERRRKKGRKGNICSLDLPVMMPQWCWVPGPMPSGSLGTPHPYGHRTHAEVTAGHTSERAVLLPSQKSAHIWYHYKVMSFPLAALVFKQEKVVAQNNWHLSLFLSECILKNVTILVSFCLSRILELMVWHRSLAA